MSEAEAENYSSRDQTTRLCDFCNESKAVLYCRADSAKLCFSCDREVHSTNQLFKKHNRSLLCDSCNSSPSSIFCCAESVVLCQNCDWETHKNFGSIHDRRPVEGFTGCPSVSELLSFLGLDDLGKKSLDLVGGNDEGLLDLLVWETPSVVSLDDLIVSNDCDDSAPSFQAMGVPPLPKNRNAVCGKHKEDIFIQLHEMAKKDPNFSGCLEDFKSYVEIQPQVASKCLRHDSPGHKYNAEALKVPSYEDANIDWGFAGGVPDEGFPSLFFGDFSEKNHLVPEKDSDVGDSTGIANGFQEIQPCVPVDSNTFQLLPTAGPTIPCIPTVIRRPKGLIENESQKKKEKKRKKKYEYRGLFDVLLGSQFLLRHSCRERKFAEKRQIEGEFLSLIQGSVSQFCLYLFPPL